MILLLIVITAIILILCCIRLAAPAQAEFGRSLPAPAHVARQGPIYLSIYLYMYIYIYIYIFTRNIQNQTKDKAT